MGVWQGRDGESGFEVDNAAGSIALAQIDPKQFELRTQIRYHGPTGLDEFIGRTTPAGELTEAALEEARSVGPTTLARTDLASVPRELRWFVGTYGFYTPAALIHDRLIGRNAPPLDQITDQWADRYFRFMLADLGVPTLRRWLMWTAVAFGTRFRDRRKQARWSLIVWLGLSVAGIVLFALSLFHWSRGGDGTWPTSILRSSDLT